MISIFETAGDSSDNLDSDPDAAEPSADASADASAQAPNSPTAVAPIPNSRSANTEHSSVPAKPDIACA